MRVLSDGLSVFVENGASIAVFFVTFIGLGVLIARHFIADEKNIFLILPLSISLGTLPLALIAFALVLFETTIHGSLLYGGWIVVTGAVIVLFRELMHGRSFFTNIGNVGLVILGITIFLVYLLVNLAFLKPLLFPPYSDSPTHYLILQNFVSGGVFRLGFYSLQTIGERYYHFGFHSIAAWLVSTTRSESALILALMGQLFIIIFPFSVFVCAWTFTKNLRASFFASLLTALGWNMPGFAANWGKYPALAGLSMLPAIPFVWMIGQQHSFKPRRLPAYALMLSGAIVFVHTRMFIILFLALLSIFLATKVAPQRELRFQESIPLALVSVLSLTLVWDVLSHFYCSAGCFLLGFTALLLPFAFMAYPGFSIGIMLFVISVWLISVTPALLPVAGLTWLDKPFVEILLLIPLSLLGGAGITESINRIPGGAPVKRLVVLIVITIIGINFVGSHSFYPDPCCNYVRKRDLEAIQWIKENTPLEATILIPAIKSNNYLLGTDAGIWVYPLTGRNISKVRYDINRHPDEIYQKLCQPNVYIFVSDRPLGFKKSEKLLLAWVSKAFEKGESKVFRVLDCPLRDG